MERTKQITVWLVVSLLSINVLAAEDIGQKLQEFMTAEAESGRFSGSVLVVQKSKTLLKAGYRFANIEHQVRNLPKTRFRIGSITKQFTAMAVMILQDRGKLQVDDAVSKYVTDAPDAWKGVTSHHLLTHTSGIPSFTGFPDYRRRMPLPSKLTETIDRFRNMPLQFSPGSKFRYNNSGYILLGAVIEKTSGMSYADFLKKEIFKPLKMKQTGYDLGSSIIPHRASGYTSGGRRNAAFLHMSIPHAAGALYSSVEDLKLWSEALSAKKLIRPKSYTQLYKPVKNGYAYGWSTRKRFNRKCLSHGGGINGFRTHIARFPNDKVLIVVLSNYEDVRIARVLRGLGQIVFAAKSSS